ncbi:hypothetical protein GQ43DRAFT_167128 [Delitschia confertaspora ATCC 74209]|uniref:Uncharacterized protein n=1 Tax=Delitschia confertaspora ATCC 74209 TaxID=1513339 RepID=A0A9P4JKE5_9PLEO|nr:hypothetical protein GQ43DRAFT_167128 [Delitschia confertaspora ATCC 74209]
MQGTRKTLYSYLCAHIYTYLHKETQPPPLHGPDDQLQITYVPRIHDNHFTSSLSPPHLQLNGKPFTKPHLNFDVYGQPLLKLNLQIHQEEGLIEYVERWPNASLDMMREFLMVEYNEDVTRATVFRGLKKRGRR